VSEYCVNSGQWGTLKGGRVTDSSASSFVPSSVSQETTVAVVGLGYWGPNIVRNLCDLPEAHVSHVYDLDRTSVGKILRRYPSIAGAARYDEILDDEDVDAVAVATPVSTHYELARNALERGKHVFVEKPLACSTAEGLQMVSDARDRGLVLMPGHTFLYSPAVNFIRGLIQSGDLGEIYFISTSRVNLGLYQPDVSVVWDLAPHDFSILRYWLDEVPTRVAAWSRNCIIDEIEDVAFINLEFPSGTVAHVELSWLAPSKLRRTTIVGSKRMVVYDDMSAEPVRIYDSGVVPNQPESFGEYQLSYRSGDVISPRMDTVEPLREEMLDFCRAIRTGESPRSSWEVGIDVVRMIQFVLESLSKGGAPVAVGEERDPFRQLPVDRVA
jgi:predicted dehydrogenase